MPRTYGSNWVWANHSSGRNKLPTTQIEPTALPFNPEMMIHAVGLIAQLQLSPLLIP